VRFRAAPDSGNGAVSRRRPPESLSGRGRGLTTGSREGGRTAHARCHARHLACGRSSNPGSSASILRRTDLHDGVVPVKRRGLLRRRPYARAAARKRASTAGRWRFSFDQKVEIRRRNVDPTSLDRLAVLRAHRLQGPGPVQDAGQGALPGRCRTTNTAAASSSGRSPTTFMSASTPP
jgi:hypothetical protein